MSLQQLEFQTGVSPKPLIQGDQAQGRLFRERRQIGVVPDPGRERIIGRQGSPFLLDSRGLRFEQDAFVPKHGVVGPPCLGQLQGINTEQFGIRGQSKAALLRHAAERAGICGLSIEPIQRDRMMRMTRERQSQPDVNVRQ